MNCSEVIEQLAEFLDEEDRTQLCIAIEEHLSRCTDCQIEVDTIKKTIVLYQNDRPVEMPPHLSSQLAAALAREYRSASPETPGSGGPPNR